MSKSALLRLERVSLRYSGEWIVRAVDLEIFPNEVLSIIGPNGAGKSTLIKAIAGLLRPAEGAIHWEGGLKPADVAYVPQQLTLDRTIPFSVGELLTLNLRSTRFWLGGVSRSQRKILLEQLAVIESEHLLDRRISALSGGEFQRVMIAYALLQKPKLLLLDEPMTGVDSRASAVLGTLIERMRNEQGLSIVLVSHDLHLVSRLSDRVCCLMNEICALGTPQEVLHGHLLERAYGQIPFFFKAA